MEYESHSGVRSMDRHSVLQENRQTTNKIVRIIFVIAFLLWLVAAIYGVAVPSKNPPKLVFDDFDTARIFTAIGFIFLSASFTFFVFIAWILIPKITTVILFTFWLPVPIFIAAAIFQISFWSVYTAIGAIFNCFFMVVIIKSEWFHLPEAVLKEACKMIFTVPSTFVFALFTYLLSEIILGLTMAAVIKMVMAGTTISTMLLIIIIFFFGIWTLTTVIALSWMTLSGTFAEYYYAKNKENVTLGTLLNIFKVVCRYHLGTAAMYNPLIGGVRALVYLLVLGVVKFIEICSNRGNISLLCFILYNIFDPVALRIAFMGSAASCSIKGGNFYDSMVDTLSLFEEKPKSFLIVVKVLELLMGLSGGLVLSLTTFSTLGYLTGNFDETSSWPIVFIYLVILCGILFLASLLACVSAAGYSTMLCICDEINDSRNSGSRNSRIMSPKLYSALNHDGSPNWFRNSCCCCIADFEYNSSTSQ